MLKYKTSDTERLIKLVSEIQERVENLPIVNEELIKELTDLSEYPINVIETLMECISVLEIKDENYLKENYQGVIAYITLCLNLAYYS